MFELLVLTTFLVSISFLFEFEAIYKKNKLKYLLKEITIVRTEIVIVNQFKVIVFFRFLV